MTSALKRLMAETEINGKPLPPGETVADMLARVIRKAAFEGDVHFMRILLERNDGPVASVIQGDPNRPLRIVVDYADVTPPDPD